MVVVVSSCGRYGSANCDNTNTARNAIGPCRVKIDQATFQKQIGGGKAIGSILLSLPNWIFRCKLVSQMAPDELILTPVTVLLDNPEVALSVVGPRLYIPKLQLRIDSVHLVLITVGYLFVIAMSAADNGTNQKCGRL